ncbi:MAG: hypothetical protein K5683_02940 [Prevotella sp.]|nr:hypothetical protein [Prevotella sp.]
MTYALINGEKAYPSLSGSIKLVLDNPNIKDSEEKTMEMVFPMSIPENREVFGNLHRLDTHFHTETFTDCQLICDNMVIIRGVGTITGITNKEVKLQILAGKSSARYKADAEKTFIDKIDYGEVASKYKVSVRGRGSSATLNMESELLSQGFWGEPGKYAFLPVYDETNDVCYNMPTYGYPFPYNSEPHCLVTLFKWYSVQPNLMYVMKKVMEKLGYTVTYNRFDCAPWNRLYVCGHRRTLDMAMSLPHWTIATFLDEFRKLFNAVYRFDSHAGTVSILAFNELDDTNVEVFEPAEEFSSSFDEEGLEYLGSSNLQFSLSSCERGNDCLTQEVRKAFDYEEFETNEAFNTAWASWSQQKKLTTIIRLPSGFWYGAPSFDDQGALVSIGVKRFGQFSPMVRDDDAKFIDLKICPVAMSTHEAWVYGTFLKDMTFADGTTGYGLQAWQLTYSYSGLIANMDMEEVVFAQADDQNDTSTEDEKVFEYVTVAEVLENEEGLPDDKEEDSIMEVLFASGRCFETNVVSRTGFYQFDLVRADVPEAYTDSRDVSVLLTGDTLSLNKAGELTNIGAFHNGGFQIRRTLDGNDEVQIPFLCDGKPDPTHIYMFRNKKFLCSKIEMNITERGIDRLKTGYFYELF